MADFPTTGSTALDSAIICATLVGPTLISLLTTRHFAKRAEKSKKAVELHKDFTSQEMTKSRSIAYDLLTEHHSIELREIAKLHKTDERVYHLLRILYFFEHLAVCVKYDYVDPTMVPPLFGNVFHWWYLSFFDGPLGLKDSGFEIANDIIWLFHWFQDRMLHTEELDAWHDNAWETRMRRPASY